MVVRTTTTLLRIRLLTTDGRVHRRMRLEWVATTSGMLRRQPTVIITAVALGSSAAARVVGALLLRIGNVGVLLLRHYGGGRGGIMDGRRSRLEGHRCRVVTTVAVVRPSAPHRGCRRRRC